MNILTPLASKRIAINNYNIQILIAQRGVFVENVQQSHTKGIVYFGIWLKINGYALQVALCIFLLSCVMTIQYRTVQLI